MRERAELPCSFAYEHTDIAPGLTLAEYRASRRVGSSRRGRRRRWLRAIARVIAGIARRRRAGGRLRGRVGRVGPVLGPRRFGPAG